MNFDQTLDLIGNVTWRSGQGNFSYHPTNKHAVTAAGTVSDAYDAAGQMTSRAGKPITWKSFGQPLTVRAGSYRSTFDYTPDRRRWGQSATYYLSGETTRHLGNGLLERTTREMGETVAFSIGIGSLPTSAYSALRNGSVIYGIDAAAGAAGLKDQENIGCP